MKYTAIAGDQTVEIEFEQRGSLIEAKIGDRTYILEATAVEPGVYWLNWNHRSIEVTVSSHSDGFTASIGANKVAIEILDARNALKKAAQHGQAGVIDLKAPMPGKIVKVLVAEGAEVNANQGLLVMEAMKMQNELKSPKKGIVRKLAVSEGLAVNSGDLLVSVE
jgi:biotin carboxyl carrier protein